MGPFVHADIAENTSRQAVATGASRLVSEVADSNICSGNLCLRRHNTGGTRAERTEISSACTDETFGPKVRLKDEEVAHSAGMGSQRNRRAVERRDSTEPLKKDGGR